MERLDPRARRDAFGSKINRDRSPVLVYGVPWLTIMLGSLAPLLPVIALAPLMPPFGYLMMLAWRLVRPGLLPLWAGLPLGLVDDLYSGQPLGSGILLFSLTMLAIDQIELRLPWRGFMQDWLLAAVLLAAYLPLAASFSGAALDHLHLALLLPQFAFALVLFPLLVRIVGLLDQLRLLRVKKIG